MPRVKANDHDDKKARILSHASVLFVSEGFSRTSMTQLARACDISKSNLYHYYRDKETILFNLIDEHLDDIITTLRARQQEHDKTLPLIESLIVTILTLYQDGDHTHRVLLNDLQVLPAEKQAHIRRQERQIVQIFKDAIVLDHPSYRYDKYRLSAAAMTLLGSINWSFTWFKSSKGLTLTQYAQFLADTYRHGLGNEH